MIEDEYTIVSEGNDNESKATKTSLVSHLTFANLAKNIKGEKSHYGFAMI